jgi:hypothetical protein
MKNTQKHIYDLKHGTGLLVVRSDKEQMMKNQLCQNMMLWFRSVGRNCGSF